MTRLIAVMCVSVCFFQGFTASAQIIYEPVQYQYHVGSNTFYYGGQDPRVFEYAEQAARTQDYSAVTRTSHAVAQSHVYTDGGVRGNAFDNAYTGYRSFTANDARDEAYNNVPRYFRKRDLLRTAVPLEDGSWVVPAQAQPRIDIRIVKPFGVGPSPDVSKGMILIVPKKYFEKKNKSPETTVARAGE